MYLFYFKLYAYCLVCIALLLQYHNSAVFLGHLIVTAMQPIKSFGQVFPLLNNTHTFQIV